MKINYYNKLLVINTIKAIFMSIFIIIFFKMYNFYLIQLNLKEKNYLIHNKTTIKNDIKKINNYLQEVKVQKIKYINNEIDVKKFDYRIKKYIKNINKNIDKNIIKFINFKTILNKEYINVIDVKINYKSDIESKKNIKKIFNLKLKNIYIKKLNGNFYDITEVTNKSFILKFKQKVNEND